jgi:hypothetical protein
MTKMMGAAVFGMGRLAPYLSRHPSMRDALPRW